MSGQDFARQVLQWFEIHGRHDLPWQQDPTPYRVWVSEIMLQQTRVATVIPYFAAFMDRFPDVQALADGERDEVLHLWTGLGYYARARNLHRTAGIIRDEHGGRFPADLETLLSLPGIGRSTAGAILSLGHSIPAPILDGNVKRVLARCFAVEGWPGRTAVARRLWELTESLTPGDARAAPFNQAMMDLGATVCTRTRPACERCPLAGDCVAHREGREERYPGRKPATTLPVRSTCMLMVTDGAGHVLLQRRPAEGIWGGLWSFPECGTLEEAPQRLRELPVSVKDSSPARQDDIWPPLRHTFSHYHLDITPLQFHGRTMDDVAEPDDTVWYPLDHAMPLGLAAPVRRLLDRLADGARDTGPAPRPDHNHERD